MLLIFALVLGGFMVGGDAPMCRDASAPDSLTCPKPAPKVAPLVNPPPISSPGGKS